MYKTYYSIAGLLMKEINNVSYYIMEHIVTCKESENDFFYDIEQLEKVAYEIFEKSKKVIIDKYRVEKIDIAEVVKIKE